jgi:hypothetical protein
VKDVLGFEFILIDVSNIDKIQRLVVCCWERAQERVKAL